MLGCVIYIKGDPSPDGKPRLLRHTHDFLSSDTKQDAAWTLQALRITLSTFKNEVDILKIWSDNGIEIMTCSCQIPESACLFPFAAPHFHCSEVLSSLPTWQSEFSIVLEWNFTVGTCIVRDLTSIVICGVDSW